MAEWDPVRASLTNIEDRLGELIALLAAAGGSKVNIRPRPRPRPAIERIREEMRMERHQRLVQRLIRPRPN